MSATNFLEGILDHVKAFASIRGVSAGDIRLHVTLADGSLFEVTALTLMPPSVPSGFGMLSGIDENFAKALLIRESHVLKIELQMKPEKRKPIGFH